MRKWQGLKFLKIFNGGGFGPKVPKGGDKMKKCRKCDEVDQGAFYASQKTICKPCQSAYNRDWSLANTEQHRALQRRWDRENPEKKAGHFKKHYDNNTPKMLARNKQWHKDNPGASNARGAKRRATKRSQTPEDANLPLIKALYTRAAWLKENFGVDIHVDHRIPLSKGGEHTIENLQLLPAYLNLSKGAKLWVVK